MFVITITNLKQKVRIILKFFLLLLLVSLIIPYFFNFVSSEISDLKESEKRSPALRVEQHKPLEAGKESSISKEQSF